jgi:Transposase
MDVFLERCAGLDVHQASVVCCVLIGAPGRTPQKLLRNFGTTTRDLKALRAWLAEHGVTHVGMESTGVYWKPVYAVLEGDGMRSESPSWSATAWSPRASCRRLRSATCARWCAIAAR